MKRRNFLQLMTSTAVAAAVRLPLLESGTPSLCSVDSNYWALQQRIRQLVTQGYQVGNFTMDREEGGFRFSSIRLNDQAPLTWYQAWALMTHQRENIHYDFRTCDCGAKTFTPHDWRCVRATHLAHHLRGDWSRFRKTDDPDVEINYLDTLRSIRRSRRGLTPDIAVARLDRTLQDLRLAGIDLVPVSGLSNRWRPPVGYSYQHRCDWASGGIRRTEVRTEVTLSGVCETEQLEHVGWTRYPILLRGWYVVNGKAHFPSIFIS